MKAFPLLSKWDDHELNGMDLRDYFAAKAMAQMNWVNVELSAQEAYRVADAMMKAREQ